MSTDNKETRRFSWNFYLVVVLLIVCVIVGVIILLANYFSFESETENDGWTELDDVELAVAAVMAAPDPPILDLDTDERIVSYNDDISHPTNIMTNGGLITIADDYLWTEASNFTVGQPSDLVVPPSEYLSCTTTTHYYTVDSSGNVRGFRDEHGQEEMK